MVDYCATAKLEAFFFSHGPDALSDFDREQLWPGRNEDSFLAEVEEITKSVADDYLQRTATDLYDPDHGLLDPGYRH